MKQVKKMIFYEVNPRYFKDNSLDGIGDLTGMENNFEYFEYLNVDSIILQDVFAINSDDHQQNFTQISSEIGDVNAMIALLSTAKRSGKKVLIEMNIGTIKKNHSWFSAATNNYEEYNNIVKFEDKKINPDLDYEYSNDNQKYYLSDSKTKEIPINWKDISVHDNFVKVVKFWANLGIDGFVFKKFEYLTDEAQISMMSENTLKELRNFFVSIKEVNHDLLIIAKSDEIKLEDVKNYVEGPTRVFDYFLSTRLSMIGVSNKYGIDVPGSFSPNMLAKSLKNILKSNASIITFNSNHVGKVISRWTDDGQYIAESAKSLGLLMLLNNFSSSIYQGDELGIPNIGLTHLDNFQDSELLARKERALAIKISERDFMNAQVLNNPINAKSLMPWNDSQNGGFSSAEKTITPVSTYYKEINVKNQYANKCSVLNFYRKLINIVKSSSLTQILSDGTIKISSSFSGIIKYKITFGDQTIFVFVNLTNSIKPISRPKKGQVLFSTYDSVFYDEIPKYLEAYEGIAIATLGLEYIKSTQEIKLEKLKVLREEKKQKAKVLAEKEIAKKKAIIQKTKIEEQTKIAKQKQQEQALKAKVAEVQRLEKERLLKQVNFEKAKSVVLEKEKNQANDFPKIKSLKNENQEKNHELNQKKPSPNDPWNFFDEDENEKETDQNNNKKDFVEVKKMAIDERNAERSHLDEATKLKEDEIAKTTLIDDKIDLDDLFDYKK